MATKSLVAQNGNVWSPFSETSEQEVANKKHKLQALSVIVVFSVAFYFSLSASLQGLLHDRQISSSPEKLVIENVDPTTPWVMLALSSILLGIIIYGVIALFIGTFAEMNVIMIIIMIMMMGVMVSSGIGMKSASSERAILSDWLTAEIGSTLSAYDVTITDGGKFATLNSKGETISVDITVNKKETIFTSQIVKTD